MSRLAVAKVAHHLQAILDDLVIVGGCAAALLVPPPADANLRPTDDVDCVMSITSYAEFSALEMKLRELGCSECRDEGAPLCRWVIDGVLMDFMPTEERVLGFSNKWYPERSIENIVSGCFEADPASQALVPTVMLALRNIATSM